MSNFQIKTYDPNARAQALRISQETWQQWTPRMRDLHIAGVTTKKAREILKNEAQAVGECFEPS